MNNLAWTKQFQKKNKNETDEKKSFGAQIVDRGTVLLYTAAFLLMALSGKAATITSAGSGNWNSTTPNAPWPGGNVPTVNDDVIIADADKIDVTADAECASLTVQPKSAGGRSKSRITVLENMTLSVTGGVTVVNKTAQRKAVLRLRAGAILAVAGDIVNGTTATFNCQSCTVRLIGSTDQSITTGGDNIYHLDIANNGNIATR